MSVCPCGRRSPSETEIRPPSVVEPFRVFQMEKCRRLLLRRVCVDILSLQKAAYVLNSLLKRQNCEKKKKKKKQEKSESQLCYALAQDQVRNLLDCLVFSSHMFLIDTPGHQPCPFLQLIQISVIKWTVLHVIMLAVGVSVSLNTVDVVCILVAFKEFCFVLLTMRFWPILLLFGQRVRSCLSMAHVVRNTLANHIFMLQKTFI